MENLEKSKKRMRMIWAQAVAITALTVIILSRQPEFNSFRPVHLALVFACGLVIGAAMARTRMYYRSKG